MTYKRLCYVGIFILLISILIGIFGPFLGILGAFDSLKANETAEIGAVGEWLNCALVLTIASIIGAIIGGVITIVASVKMSRASKLKDQQR